MYDLYRHLKLTAYSALIRKDAPFPSEKHARNWRKIGTIETVSPEAKRHIDQKGFCIYVFTPALSFDEIEGSNEDTYAVKATWYRLASELQLFTLQAR